MTEIRIITNISQVFLYLAGQLDCRELLQYVTSLLGAANHKAIIFLFWKAIHEGTWCEE